VLEYRAPAKVNLVLEVTGSRPDGFHEIKSIVQTISIYDEISLDESEGINFKCNDSTLINNNLVLKAVEIIRRDSSYDGGVTINLKKTIPVSAGLGGGSSDAAVTLIGLNKLWELGYSEEHLMKLALQLGSDVPFFIKQGISLVEGRGDKITCLPALENYWLVIMVYGEVPMQEKTSIMYSKLKPSHYTTGIYTASAVEYIKKKRKFDSLLVYNVFEDIAQDIFNNIVKYRQDFYDAGANQVHLSGSGPTLFTITKEREEAANIVNNLREIYHHKAFVAGPCGFNSV
jgi:4-diphosphocytidyl-2-C-methyl-D-erythritol kinase